MRRYRSLKVWYAAALEDIDRLGGRSEFGKVKEAPFIHIVRPARKPQKILLCGWRRDIDDMIVVWRGNLPKDSVVSKSAKRIPFCGWRRNMEDMVMVLDACLAPGSKLCTWFKVVDVNEVPEKEREKKLIDGGLDINRLVNITLVNCEGNVVIRCHLESIPLESFDSWFYGVMGSQPCSSTTLVSKRYRQDSATQADSRSLAILLLIRDIQAKHLPYKEAAPRTQVQRGNSFSQGSWIGEIQQASDNSVIIRKILDSRTKNLLCGMNEYDVQSKISHTGSWIGETEVLILTRESKPTAGHNCYVAAENQLGEFPIDPRV
ncbi:hypothetical protein LguiB_009499 [Lonicera macranthoides]